MATQTYTHGARGASLAERFGDALTDTRAAYGRWRLYRRTRDELSTLSDRDLADLGVVRGDIETIARSAAYGG